MAASFSRALLSFPMALRGAGGRGTSMEGLLYTTVWLELLLHLTVGLAEGKELDIHYVKYVIPIICIILLHSIDNTAMHRYNLAQEKEHEIL